MVKRPILCLAVMIAIVAAITTSVPAYAYCGSCAANWADSWALGTAPGFPRVGGTDCANFTSQAMHVGGGYPFRNFELYNSDDHGWWYEWIGPWFNASYSWTASWNQVDFLWLDWPGASSRENFGPHYQSYGPNSQGSDGDIIYYNWGVGSGSARDHTAIRSTRGYDPNSGIYGDLVDAHTTDRKHALWDLSPYNGNWYTTTITVYNISPAN